MAKEIDLSIMFALTQHTSSGCIQNLNTLGLIAGEKSVIDGFLWERMKMDK